MCQLENGALFRMKREKVKELKQVLELIRAYKSALKATREHYYTRVLWIVRTSVYIETDKGFPLTAELISRRANVAGLPV